jgi:hypothetical protein
MCLFLQLHLQNGSVGNEELSAASVLARLGVTVDGRGNLVRDRPTALLSGQIAVSNKENVMDEPKEEDEKKTAEVCMAEMWRMVCVCNGQHRRMVCTAVQATPNDST